MTIQQLKYLVELSRYRSISKASEALFVSQPAITKAIRELEHEFGITIISRSSRGVAFTEDGKELLFYAKSIVEQSEAIRFHFHHTSAARLSRYTVSSQHHSYVIAAVASLVNRLHAESYEIYVHEGKTDEVIRDVSTGSSMVGFLAIQEENRPMLGQTFQDSKVEFFPVISRVQHAYLGRNNPLASCDMLTREQLFALPLVTYQHDDVSVYISEWNTMDNSNPKRIYLSERASLMEIIAHTDGYALGTGLIAAGYVNPDIVTRPIKNGAMLQLGYILPAGIPVSEELRQIIDDFTSIIMESAGSKT